MERKHILLLSAFLITTALVLTECKKTDVPAPNPYAVKLANTTAFGNILTDKDGYALYFFTLDVDGANHCGVGCTAAWPIFYAAGLTQAKLTAGLSLADFDSITTAGGKQLTYKGWPLYYYAPGGVREMTGQITGDGVGEVWFVAKPDYTIMLGTSQLVGANGKDYVVTSGNVYTEGTGMTTYFTNENGRSIYAFSKDSSNIDKFTKPDLSNNAVWPICEISSAVVPSSLDKTLFGVITSVGKTQLTYKGWPLYHFGADVDVAGKYRGNTKGVSVPNPGIWPVMVSDIPAAPKK